MAIRVKRVYAEPASNDGYRVLVDRVWPRGLSKERAQVDLWLKEAAPSASLRKWFGHDSAKWESFRRHYAEELVAKEDVIEPLRRKAKRQRVTLLFAARDTEHNNAVALKDYLEGNLVSD